MKCTSLLGPDNNWKARVLFIIPIVQMRESSSGNLGDLLFGGRIQSRGYGFPSAPLKMGGWYESGPSTELAYESNSQVQVGRARRLLQEQLLFLFLPSEEVSRQNIKGRKRQKLREVTQLNQSHKWTQIR